MSELPLIFGRKSNNQKIREKTEFTAKMKKMVEENVEPEVFESPPWWVLGSGRSQY